MFISSYLWFDFGEGNLEVTLWPNWTDEKQRLEETENGREKERRSENRKSQKKENSGVRKGRKVVKHSDFIDLWLWRAEKYVRKCGATPLCREASFEVKMYKTQHF